MERIGRYGKRKIVPKKQYYADIPTPPQYEKPEEYER